MRYISWYQSPNRFLGYHIAIVRFYEINILADWNYLPIYDEYDEDYMLVIKVANEFQFTLQIEAHCVVN